MHQCARLVVVVDDRWRRDGAMPDVLEVAEVVWRATGSFVFAALRGSQLLSSSSVVHGIGDRQVVLRRRFQPTQA